jgi:hypothetical protein
MLPTEIYIDAETLDDAKSSVDWLFDQYPTVPCPVSSESDSTANAVAKIMTVEEVTENDSPKE